MTRADFKLITEIIAKNAKIIDIGCADGELLSILRDQKDVSGHGLEIAAEKVAACVEKGLSVIQGDGDDDLQYYPDDGFDYAVLALTLQNMKRPKEVLQEALRIAKKVIVVIPNFGHIQNRIYFTTKGRMPVTKSLSYEWYDTPNIHFCTIKDFIVFANDLGCKIESSFYITRGDKSKKFLENNQFMPNLLGEKGVFVVEKSPS